MLIVVTLTALVKTLPLDFCCEGGNLVSGRVQYGGRCESSLNENFRETPAHIAIFADGRACDSSRPPKRDSVDRDGKNLGV